MAKFPKKHPKKGGRKKGTPNKVTADAKALMQEIVVYGLENGKRWLERTARKQPARALDTLAKLAEYVQPKLAKTDVNVDMRAAVVERRFYGTAPKVETLPAAPVAALPAAEPEEAPVTVDYEDLI